MKKVNLSGESLLAILWGALYAAWAGLKLLYSAAPNRCLPSPMAEPAQLIAAWEFILGVCLIWGRTRRIGAILGAATNFGLLGFAFVAQAQHLPWNGCQCVFAGIEFPWLPGHAILASVLVLPFLVIVVESRAERLRSTVVA